MFSVALEQHRIEQRQEAVSADSMLAAVKAFNFFDVSENGKVFLRTSDW